MQISELTYQMKPVFHPENCRQSTEEQTGIISVRQNLQSSYLWLLGLGSELTDKRDPPLALATVSFSFSAARR